MAEIRASSADWLPPKGCLTVWVMVWISQNEGFGKSEMIRAEIKVRMAIFMKTVLLMAIPSIYGLRTAFGGY
ncbi:MAG: hypothetical protein ACOYOS_01435 [Syntrophales bacterium]